MREHFLACIALLAVLADVLSEPVSNDFCFEYADGTEYDCDDVRGEPDLLGQLTKLRLDEENVQF